MGGEKGVFDEPADGAAAGFVIEFVGHEGFPCVCDFETMKVFHAGEGPTDHLVCEVFRAFHAADAHLEGMLKSKVGTFPSDLFSVFDETFGASRDCPFFGVFRAFEMEIDATR